MLSERQLEALLLVFEQRMQKLVDEYLRDMGRHLGSIGRLAPSDVHRLKEIKRLNGNIDEIRRKLAIAAGKSLQDVEQVLTAVAAADYAFMAQYYGEESQTPFLQNKAILRILQAQYRVTAGAMANLSQTTIESSLYRQAVDVAIQAAQSGVTDYMSAIRRAMREAAQEGLRVKYPNSGLTRRLDTAVRMNVLDGIRSLNNDVLWQTGEEFGADGVELSAHALCAEDHLPYQGRQYSMEAFDQLQQRLRRPIGMWNCKHIRFPILLGVSQPAHTPEELERLRRNSAEIIEIDGERKSRYDWTQEQRRIETAIRHQSDVITMAEAAGDREGVLDAQRKIKALQGRYEHVSEAAGLEKRYERTATMGYRSRKESRPRRSSKYALNSLPNNAILKMEDREISVSTVFREKKQREHIYGTKEFLDRIQRAQSQGDALPSYFADDIDIESIVRSHIGHGVIPANKGRGISEYFDAGKMIGWVYSMDKASYMQTSRVCIRYSAKGWHAFPVKDVN